MKLMHIMILSCVQATYYSSIKNFKKLSWVRRLQLKLHFSMCKSCHEFDHQSEIIDQTVKDFAENSRLMSDENLSLEQKSKIKASINQSIN